MNMARDIYRRVPRLIADFPHFLSVFLDNPPFNRAGQLEYHVDTIQLRRELGSVSKALSDDGFLQSLYRTLQAWGIGARASYLAPFEVFANRLQTKADEIAGLEETRIDDKDINVGEVARKLWNTLDNLETVTNNATIVPGTKALHHLLPDLVVPIDRAYTQKFFGWHNPEFQYGQPDVFRRSFKAFVEIARAIDLNRYVGSGWCSSRTKIIDNAIVGMLREEKEANE
jgi:hypothetical protein